ncbi:MAG: glycosyltransferase, partial [Anaerolineae bacterium]|nr:glycosyltransferase [Anaerolineae bacterium]NIN98123.1 glycosyltransferase [Anaerolineae bacterium]NIQ81055.1 glycosyltransferase [Anaerolineae bacterium]
MSIVIPAYNEEQGIESTLIQLKAVMNQQDVEYEIIVVDDGSTDRTADLVRQHQGVRLLVRHHTNRGYGAAIKTGIRQADHEWIAIIDADGTYPPEAIPSLVAETDRYDMIVGARSERDFPL